MALIFIWSVDYAERCNLIYNALSLIRLNVVMQIGIKREYKIGNTITKSARQSLPNGLREAQKLGLKFLKLKFDTFFFRKGREKIGRQFSQIAIYPSTILF
jgi:hypothetical protein